MAYCLEADVSIAVGGAANLTALADHDGDTVADPAVIGRAIAEADGLIDSMINKRFRVPVTPTPVSLRDRSAKIAARNLRRYRNMVLASDVEDEKQDIAWLEGVRDGINSLGVEPIPEKGSIVTDKAGERDSVKAVSRERLKGWW